jgi:hypothetical protein
VPYEWLNAALAAIGVRGIGPDEVLQVLFGSRRRPVPVRSPVGLAFVNVWGRTESGRPLIVTVRRLDAFDALIVGARDMSAEEKGEFEAWETNR